MDLFQWFPILVALFCFLWFLRVWLSVCGLGCLFCHKTYAVTTAIPYYTIKKCWSMVKPVQIQ